MPDRTASFRLEDYDYPLPEEVIAQEPVSHRDRSRLLCLNRKSGTIEHRRFYEIIEKMTPGDLLVINNTRVIPVRLFGRKASGGRVEIFILNPPTRSDTGSGETAPVMDCLIRASKRPSIGSRIHFESGGLAEILDFRNGQFKIRMHCAGGVEAFLEKSGTVPLPPYIRRKAEAEDMRKYQTVYASRKGAVAAPTAGLHFTADLLDRLREKGVEVVEITLHVGYGTFSPVRASDIRKHQIHSERFQISEQTARSINRVREKGKRVVAVGTTSVRVLEYSMDNFGKVVPGEGMCDLYIYPGFRFRAVDTMVTNFHLPKSSLLLLVSAFAGRERILDAYQQALEKGYRFFSYGDAMWID